MTKRFSLLERLNDKAEIYRHLETPHFNLPNNDYQRGWNEAMLFIHERYGKRLNETFVGVAGEMNYED